jgi:hypothetical protein
VKRVLAFAREPGGADAIAPVVGLLRRQGRVQVTLVAKDFAAERFRAAGLDHLAVPRVDRDQTAGQVQGLLDRFGPQALLSSASSRPEDDMTEKLLWTCGAGRGIPSVAVLDQWQNYALRFSGPTPAQRLAFLPTCIAVMDEQVKSEMIGEGIPAERILVSGHPRFDRLGDFAAGWTPEEAGKTRAELGVAAGALMVCFVSEPARRFFAAEEGYTEAGTLDRVLGSLEGLARREGVAVDLVLKYHPRNIPEDFAGLRFAPGASPLRLIEVRQPVPPWPLLAAADCAVGMISILLIDAALLGTPTLSVQINAHHPDRCLAVNAGAIAAARSEAELDRLLGSLLLDRGFREEYLARQARFEVGRGAAGCIGRRLYQLLGLGH